MIKHKLARMMEKKVDLLEKYLSKILTKITGGNYREEISVLVKIIKYSLVVASSFIIIRPDLAIIISTMIGGLLSLSTAKAIFVTYGLAITILYFFAYDKLENAWNYIKKSGQKIFGKI